MSHHRSGYAQNKHYNNSNSYQKNSDSDWKYGRARSNNLLVQISGSDRHVRRDPTSIARACFECRGLVDANNQLRLILGIKANGASEFLAPAHLATRLSYNYKRLESPMDPNMKFKSLSPVTFPNVDALKDVLGEHTSGKNGRGSKANKAYEMPRTTAQSEGSLRCQYEYTRTVLRHMSAILPYADALYGISTAVQGHGIFSELLLFSYNDYKMGSEKGFLDLAWGFVESNTLRENATAPYKIRPHVEQDIDLQNEMFSGGRIRQTSQGTPTLEVGDPDDDRIMLREHLRSCYSRGSGPICVLVHHWPAAKVLLHSMKVDISAWRTDLCGVLRARAPGFEYKRYWDDREPDRNKSRSRSPPRRSTAGPSDSIKREQGGERQPHMKHELSAPGPHRSRELEVYVIDTGALYSTVRHSANLAEGLVNACRDFNLPEVDEVRPNEYSAGNEIRYLWALFLKMADGPTIDQTYRTQFKDKNVGKRAGDDEDEENEDEDEDEGTAMHSMAPTAPQWKDPYDLQNGESDDDSE